MGPPTVFLVPHNNKKTVNRCTSGPAVSFRADGGLCQIYPVMKYRKKRQSSRSVSPENLKPAKTRQKALLLFWFLARWVFATGAEHSSNLPQAFPLHLVLLSSAVLVHNLRSVSECLHVHEDQNRYNGCNEPRELAI